MRITRTIPIFCAIFTLAICALGQDVTIQASCEATDTKCSEAKKSVKSLEAKQPDREQLKLPPGNAGTKLEDAPAVPSASESRPQPVTAAKDRDSVQEEAQAQAQAEDPAALAKKLSNPVAALISLPFQNNFDWGLGPTGDGFKYTLNIQPVIPISLNKEWNLISRTIVPIISQKDVVANGTSQTGLGDIAQAFFFSPNKSEPFVWGLGPQVLLPTATNEFLGAKKLALGPTGLILKQQKRWTVGLLAGHLWSVAGSESRPDLSLTNLQPFLSYTTKKAWTFGTSAESTYEWKSKTWNVPLFLSVSKLVKFGKQPASVGVSLKCWAASSPTGPEGCGLRFIFTPLFPKK